MLELQDNSTDSGVHRMDDRRREVTRILRAEEVEHSELLPLVYDELQDIAKQRMRKERSGHTLQATALVHEAYLKLVDQKGASWNDSGHFLAVAARAMRHLLVNYAERRRTAKRGGDAVTVSIDEFNPVSEEAADEVIALHEALDRLATVNERQVNIVEARFLTGLSIEETADALAVSPATVKRDWQLASAWLHREIHITLQTP